MKKVIIITGASSGMGKEMAKSALNDGHTVYGAARRVEKMKELEELGMKAIKMDITKESDIKNLVSTVIKTEGKIDVLVNNAGYGLYGSIEDTPIEKARRQFEVNLFGLGSLTQKVIPHMRKENSGKIINISSMGGKIYMPLGAWYHASKHALEGWSDSLRLELKQFGIDVVIVEPGIIKTEFADVMTKPLVEMSEGGVYESLAKSFAESSKENYSENSKATDPTVIAKEVLKAINSNNPKTRYLKGYLAKPLVWARKLLGDKLYDKLVLSQIGK